MTAAFFLPYFFLLQGILPEGNHVTFLYGLR